LTAPLHLDWDGLDRDAWDGFVAAAGFSAVEQAWAYGEAVGNVRRGVLRASEPLALVQAFERRLDVVTLVRLVRGPLWLDADEATRLAGDRLVRDAFRKRARRLLFWLPELPAGPEALAHMRACRTRQMVTGYSSARLDLAAGEESLRRGLHGKWRNQLKSAEDAGLEVNVTHGGAQVDRLLDRIDFTRKAKRYAGPNGALIRRFADASHHRSDMTAAIARAGGSAVAGIVLLRHGATATYFAGWTDDAGRTANAHNLLLWRGVLAMKDAGVRWLDLGGVNASAAPGIARFKLGLGATPYTLAGTFF